jgi:hypothetical protein
VRLKNHDGVFEPAVAYPSNYVPQLVAFCDIDSDGWSDIVVVHVGSVGIYFQGAQGWLSPEAYFPESGSGLCTGYFLNPHGMAIGDINGDDAPDVVIGSPACELVILYNALPVPQLYPDLLPGSCPNIINTGGGDVELPGFRPGSAAANRPMLSAAVLGTKEFDVSRVDPATVLIAGIAPVSHQMMDVSRPLEMRETPCECAPSSPDGYVDLVLYFDQAQFMAALEPITDGEMQTLQLTGKTKTGVPLSGSDCLLIKQGPIRISPMASAGEMSGAGFAAYPNPFNAATVITFALSTESNARLDVYDVLGRHVATLADDLFPAGEHQVSWDAAGRASGVYFARLATSEGMMTRKMVLVR